MKDIFTEIWEIRGTIDAAITKHDIDLFNKAKDRFLKVYGANMHLQSIACMTADREYETEEEWDFDRESNFTMLAFDLERSRREVLREDEYEVKSIQFSSPLEVLWYTRIMFDLALDGMQTNSNSRENIQALFDAVNVNLEEIIDCYNGFTDKKSIKEKITIRCIQKEVENIYNEFLYRDYVAQEEGECDE